MLVSLRSKMFRIIRRRREREVDASGAADLARRLARVVEGSIGMFHRMPAVSWPTPIWWSGFNLGFVDEGRPEQN